MSKSEKKTSIHELCEITSSKRVYAPDYQSEGVPFYRGKEIIEKHKGNLDVSTELFISENKFAEFKKKFGAPQPGDLLLTSVGTLGVPYVVKSGEVFYFKDGNLTWFRHFRSLDSRFLYYWLLSPQGKAELKKCTIGSSQSAFTIVLLKDMEIELPPLPTQQKIVEILEEADNLRKLRQQADEKTKDLIPPFFVQMFGDPSTNPKGWEVKRLKDLALYIKNGLFKRPNEFGSGAPLINVVDLFGEYKVDLTQLERVSVTREEVNKYLVEEGDLFFCRSSLKKEGVAKCAVAVDLNEPTVFECHTIMVRLNKKTINPLFAGIYLNHPGVRTYTVKTSQTATMTTVGQKDILRQTMFLPPLLLQQEFAKFVEDIEAEKARQAKSRKKLDELFNSLMQRAFAGELVA